MIKILLTGQCSLHKGRMEFGNIGNFYIMEPFVRYLHKTFPDAQISTTFQMSDSFCKRERVSCLPIDLYYDFDSSNNLDVAELELEISINYQKNKNLSKSTPYIDAVLNSDLVIDFSGDIWGENANMIGRDRFFVGLIKNEVAQRLGVKTVMLAGSPGPFSDEKARLAALSVYANMDLVTNRDPVSTDLLNNTWGFDTSNTKTLACPAFLFNPSKNFKRPEIFSKEKPVVGFIVCGWNFSRGPYNKENRSDVEFKDFADHINHLTKELKAQVCLISHSNGFDPEDSTFSLKHGVDFNLTKDLFSYLKKTNSSDNVILFKEVLSAWDTKALIGHLDMLVSGRIHGAVAGLSQSIPTVMFDYNHGPKTHKVQGFARVVELEEFVTKASDIDYTKTIISKCFNERVFYKNQLDRIIPKVKNLAEENFRLLENLLT